MATAANDQDGSSSRSENVISDDINILLLGETGVGKSTFINAFANYLTLEKMPDNDHEDLVCLVPTSFTMYDNNDEERTIQFGKETMDEMFELGDSATRSPACYEFPLGDRKVTIIDTPSIGDTRGIKQDSINFENILTFLSNYENLHCICILLKPNNARLTVIFDFCIKQLLCHLQKDASKNIVFVYTNSRGTFYKPGDTGPILKQMLKGIENSPPYVKIRYDSSTRYCLDNESFRFLMAAKCGVIFEEDTKRKFSASWDNSVKECQRLMKYIIGCREENIKPLPPHRIKDTISVNRARRMILELSRPLTETIDNISLNLDILQKHKKQMEENSTNINQDLINKYNEEKAFITKVMAEFAFFLRDNDIISYNDSFRKYLEYRIDNLETLKKNGVDNKTKINDYRQMFKDYEAQITQLDKAMKSADANMSDGASCQELSADYIFEKIEQLKGLEMSGKTIAAMQKAQQERMGGMVMRRATAVATPKDNRIFDFIRQTNENPSNQGASKLLSGLKYFTRNYLK